MISIRCDQCGQPVAQWDVVKIPGPALGQGRVAVVAQCHGARETIALHGVGELKAFSKEQDDRSDQA